MRQSLANESITDFGIALDELLKERGWNQTQLSENTNPDVSQGQISNYRYGRRSPKQPTIAILARALVPEDAGNPERTYSTILNKLRVSAGFSVIDSQGLKPEHEVIDFLRGQSTPMQDKAMKILKAAFDEEDAIDNAGNIGKRAE